MIQPQVCDTMVALGVGPRQADDLKKLNKKRDVYLIFA
jgi:hypothetical protein